MSPDRPLPLTLYNSGESAFERLLELVERAERSVDIRSFVWRDDEAGEQLARALLRAADRGVIVRIRKDRIGANYEYLGENGQSLFHKREGLDQTIRTWFLSTVYGGAAFPRQRPNGVATALRHHPNVTLTQGKFFDHSKLFVFDDERLVLGSMGIGNNHRHEWIDLMVEVASPAMVRRLRQREASTVPFDQTRKMDFLVHSRASTDSTNCPLLRDRLALLDGAQQRITVEMAYLGDRRYTQALVRAVRRGVQVTLITSANADVLHDLNMGSCDQLLSQTGAPANLTVALHPRMVHSKMIVVDGRRCDIGSANFTRISHGVYDEVNLYVEDEGLAAQLEHLAQEHLAEAQIAGPRIGYRKHFWYIERAFIAFFARNLPY